MELSTSLEDEKNRSAFLEVSLVTEKEKNDESAKTEKLVATQLKGALDVVQVLNIGCIFRIVSARTRGIPNSND